MASITASGVCALRRRSETYSLLKRPLILAIRRVCKRAERLGVNSRKIKLARSLVFSIGTPSSQRANARTGRRIPSKRDALPLLKQIEADLRDRFGKFGDEVKALLLVTEIRIRAEQKGIVSVETESSRLKCLRHSGRRDDWVQVGTRFPRLTAPKPLLRLREIISFLNNLPTP